MSLQQNFEVAQKIKIKHKNYWIAQDRLPIRRTYSISCKL
jgi:hypothetical protein